MKVGTLDIILSKLKIHFKIYMKVLGRFRSKIPGQIPGKIENRPGPGREEIAPPVPGFHGAGNPGRLLLILNSSGSYAVCLEHILLLFWRSHFIEPVQANIK